MDHELTNILLYSLKTGELEPPRRKVIDIPNIEYTLLKDIPECFRKLIRKSS